MQIHDAAVDALQNEKLRGYTVLYSTYRKCQSLLSCLKWSRVTVSHGLHFKMASFQNLLLQHTQNHYIMIIPTSTGSVFVSEYNSMKDDKSPTKLENNDIFIQFVKDFWEKITTCRDSTTDSLITSYAMLQFRLQTREVPEPFQQYIRTQLLQRPPDIVLINDLDPKLTGYCGFHQRYQIFGHISPSQKK